MTLEQAPIFGGNWHSPWHIIPPASIAWLNALFAEKKKHPKMGSRNAKAKTKAKKIQKRGGETCEIKSENSPLLEHTTKTNRE